MFGEYTKPNSCSYPSMYFMHNPSIDKEQCPTFHVTFYFFYMRKLMMMLTRKFKFVKILVRENFVFPLNSIDFRPFKVFWLNVRIVRK